MVDQTSQQEEIDYLLVLLSNIHLRTRAVMDRIIEDWEVLIDADDDQW